MQTRKDLQDPFLAHLCRSRTNVTLFLMNDYQLRGVVAGYDAFVVVLMTDQKQQVIYKHAISTIVPERAVELEGSVSAGR